MVALEGTAKGLVALTTPDGLDGFLEDVAQYTLLLVLSGALMAKGGKTARQHVAARSDVSERVGTPTTRPGALAKISNQAL